VSEEVKHFDDLIALTNDKPLQNNSFCYKHDTSYHTLDIDDADVVVEACSTFI